MPFDVFGVDEEERGLDIGVQRMEVVQGRRGGEGRESV